MKTKKCPKCRVRPITDFHKCKSRADGVQGVCKFCKPVRNKEWYEKNRESKRKATYNWQKRNSDRVKGYGLKKYGLTVEQYNSLSESQNHVCAICQQPEKKKSLAVDHNHLTGQVRALLCEACNRGLGHFRDNSELLITAASYLSRFLKSK